MIKQTLVHIYECQQCVITFAVEQAFEDQSVISCPSCCEEEWLEDVGEGVLTIG
ncbi:MAG: hypothetical protein K0Q87_5473 [Neobacillus sp.]|nr:hypothetical protein [Neobacillus sp.]